MLSCLIDWRRVFQAAFVPLLTVGLFGSIVRMYVAQWTNFCQCNCLETTVPVGWALDANN